MCPGNNTGNVHAFIMSQVDYCNSLLAGSPNYITDRQQRIVNAATGLVSGTCKFCHLCYIRSALVQRPRAYQLCVKLHVRDKRTQQTRLRQTRWWQDSLTARRLFLLRPVLHRSAQLLKIIVALWAKLQLHRHRLTLIPTSWCTIVRKGKKCSLIQAATNEHNVHVRLSVFPHQFASISHESSPRSSFRC